MLSKNKDYKTVVEKASKTDRGLYHFLMDQKVIAGLGNIYVQEILFEVGLSPFKTTKTCNEESLLQIRTSAKGILKKALKSKGSTIHTYKNSKGESGSFQDQLKVYGKKKAELCKVCGAAIKIVRHGRTICYCPNCQKN